MTKKEHQVEINFEADEQLQEKIDRLEESGHTLEVALKNYIDAIEYDWENYIENYHEVHMWFGLRGELLELINKVDQKIDEFIENVEEKSED